MMMKPLLNTPSPNSLKETEKLIKKWANELELDHKIKKHSVGSIHIINETLAIGLHPKAKNSQELRDLQEQYSKKNIELYYIYPWDTNREKFLTHFQSKLGLDSRKYSARRLKLEVIANDAGNKFMRDYHIQSSANGVGKISIALLDKKTDEVLAVQQFARYRFGVKKGKGSIQTSPVWEGLRLCFKPDVQIYGGASRLQKYFEKEYKPEKIISYVDLSHSSPGSYKTSQGFQNITNWNQESYKWALTSGPHNVKIIDKDGNERYPNIKEINKHKFLNPSRVAGAFGKGVGQLFYDGKLGSRKELRAQSENGELVFNDPILEALGYTRWWTSGQAKWVKELTENA